ncbi:MAG: hypothetical protein QM677_00890 [Microbacterium sp.]
MASAVGASATPSPLPSATGTWTPAPTDAPEGPVTAAPLPTTSATIDEPVEFDNGVTVAIVNVEATTVTAETPGEVSGDAVVVTLSVTNGSTESINLDAAVVNLTADDDGYGVGTTAGEPLPFGGDLAAGETAEGRYVFMLDSAATRTVTIIVNYGAGEPVAVFEGKAF